MTILVNFAVYDAMTSAIMANALSTSPSFNKIEIYSGTIISDADDWVPEGTGGSPWLPIGSPSNLLATFTNFRIDVQFAAAARVADKQSVVFKQAYKPSPNPVNATATGTATWYAMYRSSGMTNGPIIGDVTATGGNGTLRLDSVSLVSGNPVTLTYWGFRLQS